MPTTEQRLVNLEERVRRLERSLSRVHEFNRKRDELAAATAESLQSTETTVNQLKTASAMPLSPTGTPS